MFFFEVFDIKAEILASGDIANTEEIDKLIQKAGRIVDSSNSVWLEIDHQLYQAKINILLGRKENAIDSLNASRMLYQAKGLTDGTPRLKLLEQLLAKMH